MDKDAYIKQLEEENAALKKRIEELERRLGMNSQNSSKPPSTDPPDTATVLPRRLRKKRGARKGHLPHLRALLPPQLVTKRIELCPQGCPCGSTRLEKTEQEPLRHQIVDIPPITPEVTEYLQSVYRCKDCGELVYQPLPTEIRRRHFGPGLLAMVGIPHRLAQYQQTQGSGPDQRGFPCANEPGRSDRLRRAIDRGVGTAVP